MENIEYLLTNDEFMNDIQSLFDFDINKLPKSILVKICKAVESNSIDIEDILADAIELGVLDVKTYMSFGNVEFDSCSLNADETQALIEGLIGIALKQQTDLSSVVSSLSSFVMLNCQFIHTDSIIKSSNFDLQLLNGWINDTKETIREIKHDIDDCQYDLDSCKFYQFIKRNNYQNKLDILNADLKRYNRQLNTFIKQRNIIDNTKSNFENLCSEYRQNFKTAYHNIALMHQTLSQGGVDK